MVEIWPEKTRGKVSVDHILEPGRQVFGVAFFRLLKRCLLLSLEFRFAYLLSFEIVTSLQLCESLRS